MFRSFGLRARSGPQSSSKFAFLLEKCRKCDQIHIKLKHFLSLFTNFSEKHIINRRSFMHQLTFT